MKNKIKTAEPNKYTTFYKAVTQSPQWKAWEVEQERRLKRLARNGPFTGKNCYDMPEVMECGWISQQHFQDFLKFCRTYTERVG